HTGLVSANADETTVRILNTNTNKIIESTFATKNGMPVYAGPLSIPGVSGTGSPIELRFIDPGGATTNKLLPTAAVTNQLEIDGAEMFTVYCVDAAYASEMGCGRFVGLIG